MSTPVDKGRIELSNFADPDLSSEPWHDGTMTLSRGKRLTGAGLVAVLAASLALGTGAADATYLVVPWVNEPATAALISSLEPKPLPAPKPTTDAPPCTSSELTLQPVGVLQWSQDGGIAIRLRNTGSSACLVRGTPDLVASASGHPNVAATSLRLAATDGEVANTPAGGFVYVDVSAPLVCASNPGGSNQGRLTYHRLEITLPVGGTRTISGLNMTFPCGMAVSPFFRPTPALTYATYWLQYLTPHVSLPISVKAGRTLVYEVTLTNPLSRSMALSPCPAYIEHSSTGVKLEYRLDCATVHTIPAHSASIYQMKMMIPSSTPSGPMTVFWSVIGPRTASSRATVNVR